MFVTVLDLVFYVFMDLSLCLDWEGVSNAIWVLDAVFSLRCFGLCCMKKCAIWVFLGFRNVILQGVMK